MVDFPLIQATVVYTAVNIHRPGSSMSTLYDTTRSDRNSGSKSRASSSIPSTPKSFNVAIND
jgi:hypothetical protein